MDKRTAKREALKIWKWLSEHDGATKKNYFETVDEKIASFYCMCPLCDCLIGFGRALRGCEACPLWNTEDGTGCLTGDSPYKRWAKEGNKAEDAKKVYDLIKAWKVR